MNCPYQKNCGGCPLRELSEEEYRQYKVNKFENIIKKINQNNINRGQTVFIKDGTRRRAEFTFSLHKGEILLGFNGAKSHEIVNINNCMLLTNKINNILPIIKIFLNNLCSIKTTEKIKNKKFITTNISSGEIWLTETVNGLDILIEIENKISLDHRISICDFANQYNEIARISLCKKGSRPETIIEKHKPFIEIAGLKVFIPAGTFLQASSDGEKALIDLVLQYVGTSSGKIADLFCGVGTFSYPLSNNIKNKITSIDSSTELLSGFEHSINAQSIPNIKIEQKNLFKYPLDEEELKNFDIIVFDPPRAGAAAQVNKIILTTNKPQKIIAVSCNPHTFINDANTLISGGYKLSEITMVDQFVYSNHFELVALFEKI